MQTISFNDRNAATGMGSVTFYLIIYFAQIILVALIKIIMMVSGERFLKKSLFKKINKGLFFNTIISLSMEGLIELTVNAFLNLYTADL